MNFVFKSKFVTKVIATILKK